MLSHPGKSTRLHLALAVTAGLAFACGPAEPGPAADEMPPEPATDGQFRFTEVVPGVYHARGVGDLVVGSNAAVIVNDDDVLLVDSHISPAAADALLTELAEITDRPVRYVANTHWHFDHAHGNQVYPPDVAIISHEATRAVIASGGSNSGRSYDLFLGSLPDRIATMEATLDTMSEGPERDELEEQLRSQRAFYAQVQEVVPTPPNTTLSERLTLYRGGREIRFLFFGRGHTEGDVVVHLPDDGVLVTGDLLTAGLPYMGDGFVNEWIDTLEHLKSLDFDWIIPGHGDPYADRERIDHLQAYLRDLWNQTVSYHERGASVEEAIEGIDLSAHEDRFQGATDVNPIAVRRIFELLDAPPNQAAGAD
ncbi:MAG: MBL fold metallo-hydrolase [Gemmatimonadota bacterium]|nr:MBL fold metallo-hydrolase [Gemmatimonadota bacterium]